MEPVNFVVTSKVKKYAKEENELRVAGDVADAISEKVKQIIDDAMSSAIADGRKTVMAKDIV